MKSTWIQFIGYKGQPVAFDYLCILGISAAQEEPDKVTMLYLDSTEPNHEIFVRESYGDVLQKLTAVDVD